MLTDNINLLKVKNINLYNKLLSYKKTKKHIEYVVETTKVGTKTLKFVEGKSGFYIHSKYNPIRESEAIVNKFLDENEIDANTHVVFLGLGMGYLVDDFLKKKQQITFSIYEPFVESFKVYLSHRSLMDLPLKNLKYLGTGETTEEFKDFLIQVMKSVEKKIVIFQLPVYERNYTSMIQKYMTEFFNYVRNERVNLRVNYRFQKRWIINSMINFKDVLSTPNIFYHYSDFFKDKPSIIVSAGPSLDDEIENLRIIKKEKLAYIFAVGSSINTLIENEIYPDFITSYDPAKFNQNVFNTLIKKEIDNIPLIFGSSIGHESLSNYPGPKIHMLTNQDTISSHFLKIDKQENLEMVVDAPSIAVITLQLLYRLKAKKIILVGQNLAYKNNLRYSKDIGYVSSKISEDKLKDALIIKDVEGNDILTNIAYNSMRQQLEEYIRIMHGTEVLNTTKGGAKIEGATFITLDKVIQNHLTKPLSFSLKTKVLKIYDEKKLYQKLMNMNCKVESFKKNISQIEDVLLRINKACNNRNFKEIEKLYIDLDNIFVKIEKNEFFNVFILPMNRLGYQFLNEKVNKITQEKNKSAKAKEVIKCFSNFIDNLKQSLNEVQDHYDAFQVAILNYKKDLKG